MDDITLACIHPFRISADYVFSSFVQITREQQSCFLKVPKYLMIVPLALLGAIVMMPLAIVALLVWMLIQHKRKPYRFSYVDGAGSTFKMTFGIATANICLLPECGSRFNNLFNTRWRAQEIGRRIVQQQLKYDNDNKQNGTGSSCHVHNDHKRCENFDFHHYISETFPSVDFLLVQEAFDLGYTQELVTKLHAVFPYIIYDVGYSSFNSNMYMCNSGMLLASKFPVEKVHFNWYKHSCNQCRFACKGVLQVKV